LENDGGHRPPLQPKQPFAEVSNDENEGRKNGGWGNLQIPILFVSFAFFCGCSISESGLRACLKKVASAILADVEPWLPARRIGVATDETSVNPKRFARRSFFPGGRMPPSMAGKDACRHIFRQALTVC
jgi:hypothetical protein